MANQLIELKYESSIVYADPFNKVTLDVTFSFSKDRKNSTTVPAFWAGKGTWIVRYSSPHTGEHQFVSKCSDPENEGLHQQNGLI